MEPEKNFHKELTRIMDVYVNKVYDCTVKFPKDEMFGSTSQLRRSALSVILNYTEGYARRKPAVFANFMDISYGSLKESKYLLHFGYKREWISKKDYDEVLDISEQIGRMLWGIIAKL